MELASQNEDTDGFDSACVHEMLVDGVASDCDTDDSAEIVKCVPKRKGMC